MARFTLFWRRIAAYYANQNPEMVFFEVLNEPEVAVYRWAGIQQSVVEAIRQAAPQNTIIVTCGEYSNPDDLVRMPEIADRNYIVKFHYYHPRIFTHQGAAWGEAYWVTLQQVPFPGTRGCNRCFQTDERLGALETHTIRTGPLGCRPRRRRNLLYRGMGKVAASTAYLQRVWGFTATTRTRQTSCAGLRR